MLLIHYLHVLEGGKSDREALTLFGGDAERWSNASIRTCTFRVPPVRLS